MLPALLTLALAGTAASEACFPELDACYESGDHTQLALNLCSHRASQICEAERQAMTARAGWMGSAPAFDKAEAAFLAFRKARCDRMAAPLEGGSGQPMVFHHCWAEVDRTRTAELERSVSPGKPYDRTLEDADATLNVRWKEQFDGTPEMRAVQRAWLAYRDDHCAWDASRQGKKKADDDCLALLTFNRTQQLADEGEP